MDPEGTGIFRKIIEEADAIRSGCLNRNDPRFPPWHERARGAIREFFPKKLPAFEEIRFASDFFLSKPAAGAVEINDRVALVSDLDEAVQLLETLIQELEEQALYKPPGPGSPAPARAGTTETLEAVRGRLDSLPFTPREREEIRVEIRRVEEELTRTDPDWDLIKRAVKYFLDLDRGLALDLVPAILNRVPKKK